MPATRGPSKTESFASSILRDLPEPHFRALMEWARTLTIANNTFLFRRGDAGDGCYWLQSGLLKVSICSPEGEKRTLAILGPGSIVGELAVLDGLPRSADVQAIGSCSLMFVGRDDFAKYAGQHPAIFQHLCIGLSARLRQANDETAAASFLPVRKRLARTLLRLADFLGQPTDHKHLTINHPVSQNDLAAMAALARESVNRTMRDWRKKGIVQQTGRAKTVLHVARLQRELTA
ncbi:MAG: Crp/Fnr family transcriptional regulator [Reyranella sp.]|uniref:Crp/Fnr family transcriptional regulator n=1 Tax=Reyranella sp. TaxID=1929291 RepID=UPI001AC97E5B|nr:Crp/Fnr family transcriptional regulator [Reyranella sp.]MBN9090434.1 Crp/Fnr family transcriptional regulator [Reyranella sp.]